MLIPGEAESDVSAGQWLCVAAQELLICWTIGWEGDRFLGGETAGVVWLAQRHKHHHLFQSILSLLGWESDHHPATRLYHSLCSLSLLLLLCLLRQCCARVGGGGGRRSSSSRRAPLMAASVSFSRGVRALPTWSSSVSGSGDDHQSYSVVAMSRPRRSSARPLRSPARMMGNVNAGKGLFAPLVVVARDIIGRKRFNQLRGKAIALHSQVITEFCKTIGADSKQRQGLIRLAKKNGEKLGFLA